MSQGSLTSTLLTPVLGVFRGLSAALTDEESTTDTHTPTTATDGGSQTGRIERLDADGSTQIEAAAAVDDEPVFTADRTKTAEA